MSAANNILHNANRRFIMRFFSFSGKFMATDPGFDLNCTRCSRLSGYIREIRKEFPAYHAAPVPAFGSRRPKLLVVGLAPGLHGANASGRPFTGDHAGILLYQMLHKHGFSNQAESTRRDDRLRLIDCRITNAVKCVPPQNKPTTAEIKQCNPFLQYELTQINKRAVILCLGGIAHKAVLNAMGLKPSEYPFAHHASFALPSGQHLLSSYHTQTRRLTEAMFDQVFADARNILELV